MSLGEEFPDGTRWPYPPLPSHTQEWPSQP